ncbi:MAG TPA: hypothetical protein VKV30_04990 [Candidatus Angelobacter sp.]|nr:hypothetical protein [Candidatus Angelobacter sp.]
MIDAHREIRLSNALSEKLLAAVLERFPQKSFGYLLGGPANMAVNDFILFEGNSRNVPLWKSRFEKPSRAPSASPEGLPVSELSKRFKLNRG